ncbi:MAG: hypothetical protein U9N81_11920 [Bacillota bacterium]|nr:hypothetical protein [Bacillota bacterium]
MRNHKVRNKKEMSQQDSEIKRQMNKNNLIGLAAVAIILFMMFDIHGCASSISDFFYLGK